MWLAAANGTAVLAPEVLRRVVDAIASSSSVRHLLNYAALLLLIALVQGVFRYLMRNTLIGVSRRVEYDLRQDFFGHLTTLSLSFFQRYRTGDLMARATNDLEAVRAMLGPGIMYSLNVLVLVPVVVVLMWRCDAGLTLAALAPFPLVSVFMNRLGQRVHERVKVVQAGYSHLTAQVQENLIGMRTVKAYARDEEEKASFRRASHDYLLENLRLAGLWASFHPIMSIGTGVSAAVVLWWGGMKVADGIITLGDLVALMAFIGMLTWPMSALGWVVGLFQRGLASLSRLMEIMDVEPEITDPLRPVALPEMSGEVKFEKVSFSYNGKAVLDDVSFTVEPGSTAALVGRTGSGKSTLLALIPRLYDVGKGRILLDGVDVREMSLARLRAAIGYVPQETFLFSTSLRENIEFGSAEGLDEQRILQAAEISRLESDVENFPEKFETTVGERGMTLSGGQKQRAALTRALVRDGSILLLDDPFSSVDPHTAEEIMEGLRETTRGRTMLLVSHRLALLRGVEKILVLDEGKIVESGGYGELLRSGGLFARMHRHQELWRELEEE